MPVANGYAQTVRAASVPTAVGVLPDEIFAAWEQPELFVTALRVAFRSLRPTN